MPRLLLGAALLSLTTFGARAQKLELVAAGLPRATGIQSARGSSGRLFIAQQHGVIRILRDGALLPIPFLDIRGRTGGGVEQGLLGLAFPPDFPTSRHFYINYTNLAGDTVIARFRVSGNPDVADAASERKILTIAQPFGNHNGGQLRFGPDGYLYIGTGDGGSGGDPLNNGQGTGTFLGKMLRIEVGPDIDGYRIPESNPFFGRFGFKHEIWAVGLRNPWRFSFDRATGDLWIADVGQRRAEEIDFQPAASTGGENYGWRRMEGFECFEDGCSQEGLTLPIFEYGRESGVSVTGGHVYRGARSPLFRSTYIYGDFGSGRVWRLKRIGDRWVNGLWMETGLGISTFGEDEAGELYLADHGGGAIYRLDLGVGSGSFVAVNGASFEPGLTPGSAATAFLPGLLDEEGLLEATGIPLPYSLGGVSVTVDGHPAPLYAVANSRGVEQVNFQSPYEIAGAAEVNVVIRREGLFEVSSQSAAFARQPAVFTLDGHRAIVVHHADNTLVTAERPLQPGEYAYFYAAGLGPVESPPETGHAAAADPLSWVVDSVTVRIGGVVCDVVYAGLAPGLVGVYQVNFRHADEAGSGEQVLVLTQGVLSAPEVSVPVGE